MNANHTQWTFGKATLTPGMPWIVREGQLTVARVGNSKDAALIAAAPNMLALLKSFVEDCEAGHEFAHDSLSAAREVIAQAEAV